MNTGGKEFWVFEHLDREGRIMGSGFGPTVSRGGRAGWFDDDITALAPFGVFKQQFTISANPNDPNGPQVQLRDSKNRVIENNTIVQRILQGRPYGRVEINGKLAPSLAGCSGRQPKD
jgi:hypothetical protein